MATRLALMACRVATQGPWTLAKGNEKSVKIVHLMEGEYIELISEKGSVRFEQPGVFPFPWDRIYRYRVDKFIAPDAIPSPTTVEIVLHG
jgi:hypothetical protein